jgi:hypothetical protein
MRAGVEVRLGAGDRGRLEAVIGSGNSLRKHVWRARIVLLSADGVGTMAIQRQTGKGKPTIWRWQARFMAEGVDGLLHDATRPGGKPPADTGCSRTRGRDDACRTTGRDDALDLPRAGEGRRGQPSQLHGPPPAPGVHPFPQQDQPRDLGRAGTAPDRRNYARHKHPKVRAWLERHPRFHFHFTPTSASWLNAVEGFFAKLTKQRLKRGVFKGIVDLQAAINRYLAETNDNPKPFAWTADPHAIIEKVRRGKQALESIH